MRYLAWLIVLVFGVWIYLLNSSHPKLDQAWHSFRSSNDIGRAIQRLLTPTPTSIPPGEGISPVMESSTQQPELSTQRILFLGNSLTYANNLPWMLVQIANSDPRNATHFIVQSATRGGAWLKDLYAWPEAQALVRKPQWSSIVLQENSYWAAHQDWAQISYAAADAWRPILSATGARVLLYSTWVRDSTAADYHDPQSVYYGQSYRSELLFITQRAPMLATRLGGQEIDIATAWDRAHLLPKMPNLYSADGNHPSVAGTYLTALVFYRFFTGLSLDEVAFVPPGMTPQEAAIVRAALR